MNGIELALAASLTVRALRLVNWPLGSRYHIDFQFNGKAYVVNESIKVCDGSCRSVNRTADVNVALTVRVWHSGLFMQCLDEAKLKGRPHQRLAVQLSRTGTQNLHKKHVSVLIKTYMQACCNPEPSRPHTRLHTNTAGRKSRVYWNGFKRWLNVDFSKCQKLCRLSMDCKVNAMARNV